MIKSSILYLIILSKFSQYPLSYFMRFIGQKFLLSTLFPSFLKKLFSKLKFCSIIKATILCKLLGGHPMLFIHANLVTMEPAPQGFLSIPDGFLLTEGSRIAALGPMSDCPDTSAFSSEEVFDLKGNTLLPGFIDAHWVLPKRDSTLRATTSTRSPTRSPRSCAASTPSTRSTKALRRQSAPLSPPLSPDRAVPTPSAGSSVLLKPTAKTSTAWCCKTRSR